MARIDIYPEINKLKLEIMNELDITAYNLNKKILKRILQKYAPFDREVDNDQNKKKITCVITISPYKKNILNKINELTGITISQAYINEIIEIHKENQK